MVVTADKLKPKPQTKQKVTVPAGLDLLNLPSLSKLSTYFSSNPNNDTSANESRQPQSRARGRLLSILTAGGRRGKSSRSRKETARLRFLTVVGHERTCSMGKCSSKAVDKVLLPEIAALKAKRMAKKQAEQRIGQFASAFVDLHGGEAKSYFVKFSRFWAGQCPSLFEVKGIRGKSMSRSRDRDQERKHAAAVSDPGRTRNVGICRRRVPTQQPCLSGQDTQKFCTKIEEWLPTLDTCACNEEEEDFFVRTVEFGTFE